MSVVVTSARRSYLASQYAPERASVAIAGEPGQSKIITLDCGHTVKCVSHFHYKIGEKHRCYQCGYDRVDAEFSANSGDRK